MVRDAERYCHRVKRQRRTGRRRRGADAGLFFKKLMADTVSTAPWVRPAARWNLPCVSRDAVLPIQGNLNLQRLAAAVLVRRGFTDVAAAREFLRPSLDSLHDPFLIHGIETAAARLFPAVKERAP